MAIKRKKTRKEVNSQNNMIRREVELADVIFILVIIGIYAIMIINSHRLIEGVETNIFLYGGVGLFVTSFILELVPQLFDPGFGVFIAMAAGMGLFNSTIIIILGSLFGSYLSYEIGRKYGLKFVSLLFKPRTLSKTIKFFKKHGKYIILFGALTPLPYFPILFGAFGLSRRHLITYGLIPRALSFVFFGLAIHYGMSWYYKI